MIIEKLEPTDPDGGSFHASIDYIDRISGSDHDRGPGREWNLIDRAMAADSMVATAMLNHRVRDPVMHEVIAFGPGENLTEDEIWEIVEGYRRHRGLSDHEMVARIHLQDTDDEVEADAMRSQGDAMRRGIHVHLIWNRVDSAGNAKSLWLDYQHHADYAGEVMLARGWSIAAVENPFLRRYQAAQVLGLGVADLTTDVGKKRIDLWVAEDKIARDAASEDRARANRKMAAELEASRSAAGVSPSQSFAAVASKVRKGREKGGDVGTVWTPLVGRAIEPAKDWEQFVHGLEGMGLTVWYISRPRKGQQELSGITISTGWRRKGEVSVAGSRCNWTYRQLAEKLGPFPQLLAARQERIRIALDRQYAEGEAEPSGLKAQLALAGLPNEHACAGAPFEKPVKSPGRAPAKGQGREDRIGFARVLDDELRHIRERFEVEYEAISRSARETRDRTKARHRAERTEFVRNGRLLRERIDQLVRARYRSDPDRKAIRSQARKRLEEERRRQRAVMRARQAKELDQCAIPGRKPWIASRTRTHRGEVAATGTRLTNEMQRWCAKVDRGAPPDQTLLQQAQTLCEILLACTIELLDWLLNDKRARSIEPRFAVLARKHGIQYESLSDRRFRLTHRDEPRRDAKAKLFAAPEAAPSPVGEGEINQPQALRSIQAGRRDDQRVVEITDRYLAQHGHEKRYTALSNEAAGIAEPAGKHRGPNAAALEATGVEADASNSIGEQEYQRQYRQLEDGYERVAYPPPR